MTDSERTEPRIDVIVSQPFAENSFVARLPGRRDCVVFDPGFEPRKIFTLLEAESLEPAAVLITHGHADHIGGNRAMKERWPDCPLVIGSGDAEKLTDPAKNLSSRFGTGFISPAADVLLEEGDTYAAAGFDFEVLKIPGHSVGHVVYVWKGGTPWHVFGGDVLFAGSVGRSDFPDGDFDQLREGIHEKLFTMPNDTMVFPGHGPATTVGHEKRTNPFVGRPAGFDW
ncbi:MAG: MBL fold metallo-hydrolase [Planctomycetales bacterium]|nr:MBL fold metallo-hydrolase [Planctomycetales bacterium]